jgi:hypothetical protein
LSPPGRRRDRGATMVSGGLSHYTGPMSKARRKRTPNPLADSPFFLKPRKAVSHSFGLEALAPLSPYTRPMFGCLAIYVGEKIVLILRDKRDHPSDNGVWLATTEDDHRSLLEELPSMRSSGLFGKPVTGWQALSADAPDFEREALRASELVLARDSRIGKVLGRRAPGKPGSKKP